MSAYILPLLHFQPATKALFFLHSPGCQNLPYLNVFLKDIVVQAETTLASFDNFITCSEFVLFQYQVSMSLLLRSST